MNTERIDIDIWTEAGIERRLVTLTTPRGRPLPSEDALDALIAMIRLAPDMRTRPSVYEMSELEAALGRSESQMVATCIELSESSLHVVKKSETAIDWEIQPILAEMRLDTESGEAKIAFARIIHDAASDRENWGRIGDLLTRHSGKSHEWPKAG